MDRTRALPVLVEYGILFVVIVALSVVPLPLVVKVAIGASYVIGMESIRRYWNRRRD